MNLLFLLLLLLLSSSWGHGRPHSVSGRARVRDHCHAAQCSALVLGTNDQLSFTLAAVAAATAFLGEAAALHTFDRVTGLHRPRHRLSCCCRLHQRHLQRSGCGQRQIHPARIPFISALCAPFTISAHTRPILCEPSARACTHMPRLFHKPYPVCACFSSSILQVQRIQFGRRGRATFSKRRRYLALMVAALGSGLRFGR
jgi:hypothetical protein